MPKVKFGLKNAHYAPITTAEDGTISYGTPKAFPGSVSMTLEAQGEPSEFYADDILYYATAANTGYQGSYEVALIPDEFKEYALGETIDEASGVMFENANAKPQPFALLFEFDTDVRALRHILYNCTVTRPSVAGNTKTKATDPTTESMKLTAAPRADGIVKATTTDKTAKATYSNWYKSVLTPPVSDSDTDADSGDGT